MTPDVVFTVSGWLGLVVMSAAVSMLLMGAYSWLRKEQDGYTFLYYAGAATACSGVLLRGTDALHNPVWPIVLGVKWPLVIVGLALLAWARTRRPGYKPKGPHEGAGSRGTYAFFFLWPFQCLAWGLGWGASLGGFAASALTLDVPMALITGASFMSYIGAGVPIGC